jgi:hypothetical protein
VQQAEPKSAHKPTSKIAKAMVGNNTPLPEPRTSAHRLAQSLSRFDDCWSGRSSTRISLAPLIGQPGAFG